MPQWSQRCVEHHRDDGESFPILDRRVCHRNKQLVAELRNLPPLQAGQHCLGIIDDANIKIFANCRE
jgi:hypothetical protein